MLLHQFYLVSTLSNSAYAAISSNMNTFVEKDGTIIEREILDGSDGKINFERITTPDGTTKVKVIENGHEYTRESSLDYDALKARIDGSEIKGTGITPYANNVEHIANRYHELFNQDSVTVTRLEGAISGTAILTILATAFVGPVTALKVVSDKAFSIFTATLDADYEDIYEEAYEVFFTVDDSYYTHCYHDTIKAYTDSGKLKKSWTHRYQSVGGK